MRTINACLVLIAFFVKVFGGYLPTSDFKKAVFV